jgi:hypothetical protein
MLVPLLATDIFLGMLACIALCVLIIGLPLRYDVRGRIQNETEAEYHAGPPEQDLSRDFSDSSEPEGWLLRLKAAYDAGYYRTEADRDRQVPLPGRDSQAQEIQAQRTIRDRISHSWLASHALAASPFSVTCHRAGTHRAGDELDSAGQSMRPHDRPSFGGDRNAGMR